MKRIGLAIGLGLVATLLLAQTAHAQLLETPRGRQGYWLGVAVGGAGASLTEKAKGTRFLAGSGFTLRLGELVTRRLGLGLLLEWASIQKGSDKGGVGVLGVEGSYNPWRNLSVKSTAGFGVIMLTDDQAKDDTLRGGAGATVSLGVAYDFYPWRKRLTGGWALTPTVDARYFPDGDIHGFSVLAGLQITYWSGLHRNHLILPEE